MTEKHLLFHLMGDPSCIVMKWVLEDQPYFTLGCWVCVFLIISPRLHPLYLWLPGAGVPRHERSSAGVNCDLTRAHTHKHKHKQTNTHTLKAPSCSHFHSYISQSSAVSSSPSIRAHQSEAVSLSICFGPSQCYARRPEENRQRVHISIQRAMNSASAPMGLLSHAEAGGGDLHCKSEKGETTLTHL